MRSQALRACGCPFGGILENESNQQSLMRLVVDEIKEHISSVRVGARFDNKLRISLRRVRARSCLLRRKLRVTLASR
jgi:hypothetical protein